MKRKSNNNEIYYPVVPESDRTETQVKINLLLSKPEYGLKDIAFVMLASILKTRDEYVPLKKFTHSVAQAIQRSLELKRRQAEFLEIMVNETPKEIQAKSKELQQQEEKEIAEEIESEITSASSMFTFSKSEDDTPCVGIPVVLGRLESTKSLPGTIQYFWDRDDQLWKSKPQEQEEDEEETTEVKTESITDPSIWYISIPSMPLVLCVDMNKIKIEFTQDTSKINSRIVCNAKTPWVVSIEPISKDLKFETAILNQLASVSVLES